MNTFRLVAVLGIASTATAQNLTLETTSPILAFVQIGTSLSFEQAPVGPLPLFDGLQAFIGPTFANTVWLVEPTLSALSAEFSQMASVWSLAPVPAAARVRATDFLLHLTTLTPMPLQISAYQAFEVSAGAPFPLVQVDVFDDGVPETVATAPLSGPVQPLLVVNVGPQGVPIRIAMENQATVPGTHAGSRLRLEVTPFNNLTIDRFAPGCHPDEGTFVCHSAWSGGGVEFVVFDMVFHPTVLVLGLSLQPAALPAFFGVPCLLVPSPDAPVAMTASTLNLPLPPAVRPVTLFAQALQLFGTSLVTTDCLRVQAH